MINLQFVKAAVDQLSVEDLHELRHYVEQREAEMQFPLSPEERIRRLDAAARAIRSGLTEVEWEAVEQAMNEEYIEPWDESEWTS